MTLILSCITREYVVQASDRRLTRMDGSLFEDKANKAIFFCGHSVFAYTGIARLSSKPTDHWLTDLLINARALADGLPTIQRAAKTAVRGIPFPSSVTPEGRRKARRLALVNVGFMLERQQSTAARVSGRYLRPILTVISNFFRPPDTWLPEDAHQAVAELKDRPGKEILMFGSWTLWNDLLVAGLIDELRLMVGAAVLGGDPGLRRRGGPAAAAGEHQAPGWLGQPAAAIRGGQPRRMMSRSPCGQGRTLRETVRGRDSRKSPGMPN
jgi:RibD C-terminal domain